MCDCVQVMHIRYYTRDRSYFTDPSMMKGWEAVFGTKEREEVDRELTKDKTEFSWGKNDSLRIINRIPAVERHPQSGHKVWFNHLMVGSLTVFYSQYLCALYYRCTPNSTSSQQSYIAFKHSDIT